MKVLPAASLSALAWPTQSAASSPPLDLIRGHYEVQMEYTPQNGWWAGVSYTLGSNFDNPEEGDIGRIDADEVEIVMPGLSRQTARGTATFLVPEDTPVWRIPQGFQRGNHFLGFRVIMPNGVFQSGSNGNYLPIGSGNVNLRLLSLTGTGPDRGGLLGTWQDGSGFEPPKIAFDTSNGIDEEDEVSILPPGTHTHYNWIFTEPGVYEVNLEVYGRLFDGTDTSFPFTLTYQVPHDGIVSSLDTSLVFDGSTWDLLCRDTEASVTYGEKHCYLHATEVSTDSEITGWQAPFSFALNSVPTSDYAGVSSTLAGSLPDFPGGVSLQLVEHIGPGEVIAKESGANPLFDSRDGLDSSDAWVLSGSPEQGLLHFTEAGIHHLEFVATGLDANGNPIASSGPLTFRCGADLAPDHSYAQWAESYERAYDLPANSLSDPNGNYDQDCLPNNLEYLLDVMGATPVERDGVGEFDFEATPPRFLFMRDLHKDSLDDSSPALFPSQSFDLETWETLTAPNNGRPISLHEVPVHSGNARSMFMLRSLRNPLGDSNRSFFQLSAD